MKTMGELVAEAILGQGKRRRVFYAGDIFYRTAKAAASLQGQTVSDYIALSLTAQMDRDFPEPAAREILARAAERMQGRS